MSANQKDFVLEKCGVFIDKEHRWIHATPDFLCSCSCCGKGCGEVKCPYSIDDCDFDSYTAKESACLEKVNGKIRLKTNHQYYYQVQQQLRISGRQFCDFVVCAFSHGNGNVIMFIKECQRKPRLTEHYVTKNSCKHIFTPWRNTKIYDNHLFTSQYSIIVKIVKIPE